jgi:HSP20 family molecular chaperone IbpA
MRIYPTGNSDWYDWFKENRKDILKEYEDLMINPIYHCSNTIPITETITETIYWDTLEDGKLRGNVEIPGVNRSDIKMYIRDDTLYIEAHRKGGALGDRTFSATCNVEAYEQEDIDASYRNGILGFVLVPLAEEEEEDIYINVK